MINEMMFGGSAILHMKHSTWTSTTHLLAYAPAEGFKLAFAPVKTSH